MVPSLRKHAPIALIIFLLSTLCLTGCIRHTLDPDELKTADDTGKTKDLRLYPSRRLVLFYDENETERTYEVNRRIRRTERRRPKRKTTPRRAPGKIVERTTSNGMVVLWVSWRGDCTDSTCAYGFVHTEDGLYKLFATPRKEGFKEPRGYRSTSCKFNRLKRGRVEALSEANDVLLKRTVLKKVKTIHLQYKMFRTRRRRVIREKDKGFD